MPYHEFVALEEVDHDTLNDTVAHQVIAQFASGAARDVAISGPTDGQFSWVDNRGQLQVWRSSEWVDWPPTEHGHVVDEELRAGIDDSIYWPIPALALAFGLVEARRIQYRAAVTVFRPGGAAMGVTFAYRLNGGAWVRFAQHNNDVGTATRIEGSIPIDCPPGATTIDFGAQAVGADAVSLVAACHNYAQATDLGGA